MRIAHAAAAGIAAALIGASAAQAATTELSVSTRLQDRREVAAGQRSYAEGFEDGRFYANGWHSTGEMGGVITPPLKLLDGVWFGIDGQWVARPRSSRAGGATPASISRTSQGCTSSAQDRKSVV